MPTSNAATTTTTPQVTSDLRLDEMTRILDVASELHSRQESVQQQLHLDDVKADLRKRLLAGAKAAGETVTPEQIDIAIEQYFGDLHAYADPPRSFSTWIANAYVRFGLWSVISLMVVFAALATWSLVVVVT